MFKPIDYEYSDDSYLQSKIIIGRSLLNTSYQFKQNEEKPILEFIKTFSSSREKEKEDIKTNEDENLIVIDLKYQSI